MPTDALTGAHAIAEEIAARDNNNLYMTSRYFADNQKYRAFCALYAVMRVVDDHIDAIPSRADLSPRERRAEHLIVERWEAAVQACYAGHVEGVVRAAGRTLGELLQSDAS
jgi:phytoene/squalene synthetase